MFFKLSLRNAKRSFKDYMIYFLTLTFGVCIFYMFNALEAQQAMLEITASQLEIMKMLTTVMGIVSLFVAFILGFLMIYANHFLVRRRKKELGLYLTLGMERNKVNLLLIMESLAIALFSLLVGLILGTFLSQGLSIVTAQLFEVNLKNFTFVFSASAALKTIIFFIVLFLVVMIFNTITISKYKLIDLLHGDKKNETLKMPKFFITCILFILSLVTLVVSYKLAKANGLQTFDMTLFISIVLGCIGTYLFFFSLAGIVSRLCLKYKKFYYNNVNLFVVKQVMSKIRTHHLSMTIICLMLFFTLGVLSTGLSMSKTLTSNLEANTPYDATFFSWEDEESLISLLVDNGFPLETIAKDYLEFNIYQSPIHYSDVFDADFMATQSNRYDFKEDAAINAIKLSDFNKLLILQGASPITLQENEYALSTNLDTFIPGIKDILKNEKQLILNGVVLLPKTNEPLIFSYETAYFSSNVITLIVNDQFLEASPIYGSYLNISYLDDKEACEVIFKQAIEDMTRSNPNFFRPATTKLDAYESAFGLSTMVTYIGIYIGFVFLIASAAILALQQLLEVTDHTTHYELLRKLGVPYSTLKRSLFAQIAIYFFAPLSLALIHASVGIGITNKFVQKFGSLSLGTTTFVTALFLVIIYGGYFLTTYITAKNIILNKK